jgi:hypothetical protein
MDGGVGQMEGLAVFGGVMKNLGVLGGVLRDTTCCIVRTRYTKDSP